ncbi:MAG: hypothetical protein ACYTAQ_12550 [Planctomycetota bacterium]
MAVLLGVPGATAGTNPPGTAITYQGELTQNFLPVNDVCNFLVTLYDGDCDAGGLPLGDPVLVPTVPVIDGVFTFQVDFGPDLFTGTERWLAIEVSCPAGQPFVALSPCQKITPAPLALAVPGLWTQQDTISPNLIGGWSGNVVAEAVTGATISGGGRVNNPHSVMDNFGTVGGGVGNSAVGLQTTVGGGANNSVDGTSSTIGGGFENSIVVETARPLAEATATSSTTARRPSAEAFRTPPAGSDRPLAEVKATAQACNTLRSAEAC